MGIVQPVALRAADSVQRQILVIMTSQGMSPDVAAVREAENVPLQMDGCGTFTAAMWNIHSGRNGGLRAL